jgi:protein kinase A
MATGMIQPQQSHHDSHTQADQSSASRSAESEDTRQNEKQPPPVAPTQVLTPHEIAENPDEKRLGFSSRNLSIDDFTLLKTLGTGVYLFTA